MARSCRKSAGRTLHPKVTVMEQLLIPALQQVPALVLFVFAMLQILRYNAVKDAATRDTIQKLAGEGREVQLKSLKVIAEHTAALKELMEHLKK